MHLPCMLTLGIALRGSGFARYDAKATQNLTYKSNDYHFFVSLFQNLDVVGIYCLETSRYPHVYLILALKFPVILHLV